MPSGKRKPNAASQHDNSVRRRIESLFLANVGKVITREQIIEAVNQGKDTDVENWHQRLSELRTDFGYTILSHRDMKELWPGQYLMPNATRRERSNKRVHPSPDTWRIVLERCGNCCEWNEGGEACGLHEGDMDPIGGGTVHLTPDHKRPHSLGDEPDPSNPGDWQALCGRHQVMKKNFWDDTTGKLNVYAIVQAAAEAEKKAVYDFLKRFFGDQDEGAQ